MGRFRIDDSHNPECVTGWTNASSLKLDTASAPLEAKKASEAWTAATRTLSDLLQCDHVMVLTGLGTSLCIRNAAGTTLFPTMSTLWSKAKHEFGKIAFNKVCRLVNYEGEENIEDLLSRCQMAEALNGGQSQVPDILQFIKSAEKTIRQACRQTLSEEDTITHEDFLRRLTRRSSRRPRACVFTTNYDQCFEVAASRIGLTVIDGFSFSTSPRFLPEMFDYDVVTGSSYSKEPDFIPRLLRLFKLHGSVDWHFRDGTLEKNGNTENPVLIYPQSGKYAASYSPPFLEIMSRFQGMLRNRNVGLLIACCGLNDKHIAEPVLSAVKSNTSLRMVMCAPDLCDVDAQSLNNTTDATGAVTRNPVVRQLNQLIDNGDTRLTLINGFFPDLVKLMPMLPVQTDAEQHEYRIKALESWVIKQKTEQGSGT